MEENPLQLVSALYELSEVAQGRLDTLEEIAELLELKDGSTASFLAALSSLCEIGTFKIGLIGKTLREICSRSLFKGLKSKAFEKFLVIKNVFG